jgi:hypothetical protein
VVVEMVGVFQELLAVHSELSPLIYFGNSFACVEGNVKLYTMVEPREFNSTYHCTNMGMSVQ